MPDLAAPLKGIAEGVKAATEGLKAMDEAGQEISEHAEKSRKVLTDMLKRRKL